MTGWVVRVQDSLSVGNRRLSPSPTRLTAARRKSNVIETPGHDRSHGERDCILHGDLEGLPHTLFIEGGIL